jgi:hypothetical protein
MPTIIEKRLAFDFADGWQVIKYDQRANPETGESAGFYRRVIEKGGVQHVRGIDLICRLPDLPERLQFIEVKDDRKRELAAGPRHAELFITVMQKVASTLAGLVVAERLGDASLLPYACLRQQPAIEVVLFLVEPELGVPATSGENGLYRLAKKQGVTALDQRLFAKLAEWNLPFVLYNLSNRRPSDWQVRDLA